MNVVFDSISFNVKETVILENVSGHCSAGALLAIMGETGSGKTSLINILSGRIKNYNNGTVCINGSAIVKKMLKKMAYVTQKDIFIGELNVLQTLHFYASLKTNLKKEKLGARIAEIIEVLALKKAEKTRVGMTFKRGLSGGELKRLNIACEIIGDPDIIFLDEPTSGLDSLTSYNLFLNLRKMCTQEGKTVITALHQPSSQIFDLFDNLLLLKNGRVMYFGLSNDVIEYFEHLSIPFKKNYNPADFVIGAINDKTLSFNVETNAKKKEFLLFKASPVANDNMLPSYKRAFDLDLEDAYEVPGKKYEISFFAQLKSLIFRDYLYKRSYYFSIWNLIELLFVSFFLAIFYYNLSATEAGVFDIEGAIFFFLCYLMFSYANQSLFIFPLISEVYFKERLSKLYRVSSFYTSSMLTDLPMQFIISFCMFLAFFFLTNFSFGYAFFALYYAFFIIVVSSSATGYFFGVIFKNVRIGSVFLNVYQTFSLFVGGYFLKQIPAWLTWSKYLSNVYYVFAFTRIMIFRNDFEMECASSFSRFPACSLPNTSVVPSQEYLTLNALDTAQLPLLGVMPFVFFLIFASLSYCSLRFFRKAY